LSGTGTYQTSADGNTVTETETLSGTEYGLWVEVTQECVLTYDNDGNLLKVVKKYTETRYDKKGGKQVQRIVTTTNDTYNAAGGYSSIETDSVTDNRNGETRDATFKGEFDGDGNRLSGEDEMTIKKPGSPPQVYKRTFDPSKKEFPLTPTSADPQTLTTANETVYLPDIAGPSSQIVATFDEPSAAGPQDVTVAMIFQSGETKYYRTQSDSDKHVVFSVAPGVTAVMLFKGFDHGKPDAAAARCQIVQNGTIPQTDAIPNPPQSGPTISRASSAYERGGPSDGTFSIQTRGNDPVKTRLLLDGKPRHIHVLAASDQEVKGRIGNSAKLGRHTVGLISGAQKSNTYLADLVTLRPDQLAPSEVGTVQPVTVHVTGLPATDSGMMSFAIGGAAQLIDGGTTATVPVTDGIARVSVRGIRAGAALVRFHLHVKIPGFWET